MPISENKENDPSLCSGCGLSVEGGTAGCQAIMDEFLARDFSEVRYFSVHRMMVDTYSLQHPDRYCASAKSFAAHLMGLCWLVENGGNRAVGSEALRRWFEGNPPIKKPQLPVHRGRMTIADVRGAADSVSYVRAVETWALLTWEAYAPLHETARQWIRLALQKHSGKVGQQPA